MTQPSDTQMIEDLERLEKAATAGPWGSDFCGDVFTKAETEFIEGFGAEVFKFLGSTPRGPDNGNAALIAASRNHLPRLLALARLGVKAQGLRDAVEFYREWAQRPYQQQDYPHNEHGFVQYDVHRELKELYQLRAALGECVEALTSIAAEKCKPSFDEQLAKLERGALVSIIDTDTALARDTLARVREMVKL